MSVHKPRAARGHFQARADTRCPVCDRFLSHAYIVRAHEKDRYDLHLHSDLSDGTNPVEEIVCLVYAAELSGFSLTDHDTMQGWDAASQAAKRHGLDFLPGLEYTSSFRGRTVHILGYGVDRNNVFLLQELAHVQQARVLRAQQMVELLQKKYRINWEEDFAHCDSRTVGRPHIADVLVERGYFEHRSAVFAQLLNAASPYYVPSYSTETTRAVELIVQAGGAAVLAHPAAARNRNVLKAEELELLCEAGLVGIEIDHPEHVPERVDAVLDFATSHDLLLTGSSDFHGEGKKNRIGECTTGAKTVAALRAHCATRPR